MDDTLTTMAGADISSETAMRLVEKVRKDPALERGPRSRAAKMARLVDSPALVLSRLQRDARAELPGMPRETPTFALARATTAAAFRSHLASSEVRETFSTASDFAAAVSHSEDPPAVLASYLGPAPILFDWERSWLAEAESLPGLSGAEISAALELDKPPPFVVFYFEVEDMIESGMTIRRPCSLDSVLGPNPQWRPEGPLSGVQEFVDGVILRDAISRIEWKE